MTPQWKRLLDHVMAVPEQVYEGWNARDGWDNHTRFGVQFGEDGVSWCVIWDWCMYADVGLAGIVPKTDNVSTFSTWAKARGQWSEYPSVGAWANFGNGSHTELVVGFDATTVYTKGGNSVKAGSTDAGQGNGVWSHATARQASRVTGYFAPHFADGCPPSADPNDPRGGRAQTSYRWPGPDPTPPTPSTPQPSEADMPLNDADKAAITQIVRDTVRSGAPADRDAYAVANLFAYALGGQVPPGGDDTVAQMAGWLHQTTQTCMGAVVDDRLANFDLESKIAAAVAGAVGPAVAAAFASGIQLTVTPSPKGN
ncbi:hypothetical protein [Kitasatospora sp. NPDC091276]|uniref:hypothetical protein n=1 Tax=unclassified Kitasatospora TaxID=2633591 RepID=UPI003448FE56